MKLEQVREQIAELIRTSEGFNKVILEAAETLVADCETKTDESYIKVEFNVGRDWKRVANTPAFERLCWLSHRLSEYGDVSLVPVNLDGVGAFVFWRLN